MAALLLALLGALCVSITASLPVSSEITGYQEDSGYQADTGYQANSGYQADGGYQRYPNYPSTIGSTYKLHCKNKASWDKALVTCQAEEAHLVVINSLEEALLVAALFKDCSTRSKYLSVGITDQFSVGHWLTVQGEPLSQAGYDLWAPGEPNNVHGKERCGNVDEAGRLNDATCSERNIFVCEKEQ